MLFLNIDFKSKPELLKNLTSLFSDCSIMKFPQIILIPCVGPKLGEGRGHAQGTYHLIVKTVISLHPSCSPESLICKKHMCKRSPRKQPTYCWIIGQNAPNEIVSGAVHLWVYSGQWAFDLSTTVASVGKDPRGHFEDKEHCFWIPGGS